LGEFNGRGEKGVKNVLVLPGFGQEDLENYLFDKEKQKGEIEKGKEKTVIVKMEVEVYSFHIRDRKHTPKYQ
jgi:hypothetical protein